MKAATNTRLEARQSMIDWRHLIDMIVLNRVLKVSSIHQHHTCSREFAFSMYWGKSCIPLFQQYLAVSFAVLCTFRMSWDPAAVKSSCYCLSCRFVVCTNWNWILSNVTVMKFGVFTRRNWRSPIPEFLRDVSVGQKHTQHSQFSGFRHPKLCRGFHSSY